MNLVKIGSEKVFNRYSMLLLKRCCSGHSSPYPKLTKEERKALTSDMLTENMEIQLDGMPAKEVADVDPDSEPFNHIYQGVEDKGFFTRTECVTDKDPSRWFWVERLLPKNNISNYPTLTKQNNQQFASGYQPINQNKPDLPYFIGRMRSGLFPVFKKIHENQSTLTIIKHIDGDVWSARNHLMEYLSKVKQLNTQDNLVTVNEVNGSLSIRGDHVLEVIKFLEETGF